MMLLIKQKMYKYIKNLIKESMKTINNEPFILLKNKKYNTKKQEVIYNQIFGIKKGSSNDDPFLYN